jgi:hypothetical protein
LAACVYCVSGTSAAEAASILRRVAPVAKATDCKDSRVLAQSLRGGGWQEKNWKKELDNRFSVVVKYNTEIDERGLSASRSQQDWGAGHGSQSSRRM